MDIAIREVLLSLVTASLKLKDYHWNLRGPEFLYLHPLLDDILDDVQEYADTLAERARAIREHISGSLKYDYRGGPIAFKPSVESLRDDLSSISTLIQSALPEYEHDLATQDVLIEIQRGLDKWVWMLSESLA